MKDSFTRFWENQFVPLGILLAVAFLVVGVVASWTALSIKNASNIISVTGSATTEVSADTASWTITATRSAYESTLGTATTQVASDAGKIQAFLKAGGVDAGKITLGAVHTDQDYSYNADANAPKRYVVREDVSVTASDPALIQKLSQGVSALSGQGVVLSVQDPQYFISNLPDLRVSLMGDAVKDARARAGEIVKNTNQSVGRLQSASSGVVQVLAAHSTDVSDYGSYDTSTIDKTVMVTVRATFFVN